MEQCARERRPLPEAIQNAPELWVGSELFYSAFLDLASCRTLTSYGEGPIPWLAIHDYCAAISVTGEQREDLLFHVERLDQAYLGWARKKRDQGAKSASPAKSRKAK